MRKTRHISSMFGVLLLAGGMMTGCQDTSPSPATWTVGEVHESVGLVGGHQSLACADCHEDATLKPISSPCEDCHRDLYDTVSYPSHAEGGFPTQCVDCHL